jgi:hypothetical protein
VDAKEQIDRALTLPPEALAALRQALAAKKSA